MYTMVYQNFYNETRVMVYKTMHTMVYKTIQNHVYRYTNHV